MEQTIQLDEFKLKIENIEIGFFWGEAVIVADAPGRIMVKPIVLSNDDFKTLRVLSRLATNPLDKLLFENIASQLEADTWVAVEYYEWRDRELAA